MSSVLRPDPTLSDAVEVAREAAADVAGPEAVGEHLGMVMESERLATHLFACAATAYAGWQWSVTVARVSRSKKVTVCEAVLLPGDGAVLAPPWIPYAERLAPGDLRPGDVLPRVEDDPRLMQGYEQVGDDDADAVALWELGLGRPRVLSLEGRAAAAQRWFEGEHGPLAPHAQHATSPCSSCGYFLPLSGSLRSAFGVCAHEWSAADGAVVSVNFGCGAHSETDVPEYPREELPALMLDDQEFEVVEDDAPATAGSDA